MLAVTAPRQTETGMSNEQLLSAYLNGELGRRQLVRRLVAGGVTLTAALAYAGAAAAPAQAGVESRITGLDIACSSIPFGTPGHAQLCGG